MPLITLAYGLLVVAISVAGYFLTGAASVTALIPAFLGAAIAVCGFLAKDHKRRKLTMHLAVFFAVVVTGGAMSRGGLLKLGQLGSLEDTKKTIVLATSAVALVSLVYLAVAIRSFILARKKPAA